MTPENWSTLGKRTVHGASFGGAISITSLLYDRLSGDNTFTFGSPIPLILYTLIGTGLGLSYGAGEVREQIKGRSENIRSTIWSAAALGALTGVLASPFVFPIIQSISPTTHADVATAITGGVGAFVGGRYGYGRTRLSRKS